MIDAGVDADADADRDSGGGDKRGWKMHEGAVTTGVYMNGDDIVDDDVQGCC